MALDGYLPPVIVNVVATDKTLLETLADARAALAAFADSPTEAQVGITADRALAELEALKATVESETWYAGVGVQVRTAEVAAVLASLDATIAMAKADMTLDALDGDAEALALAGAGGAGAGGVGGLLSALGVGSGGGVGGITGALGKFFSLKGMAGFGTILSLMGFGAEHVLASGVGILGSMVGAGIGAGFLGTGALGVGAVGFGTDLAGIGQATGDIQTYMKLKSQLTQAAAVYGKTSVEYKTAEYEYQQWADFLTKATVAAVAKVSQTLTQVHTIFDKVTATAETKGAQIITALAKVGEKFLPVIGQFASQNMTIIMQALQPFERWLATSGKEGGLGIFTQLEKVFQSDLPAGMEALEQGFELLAKTVQDVSPFLGEFTREIADFFTEMNGATSGKWKKFVDDMITDFHDWAGVALSLGSTLLHLAG